MKKRSSSESILGKYSDTKPKRRISGNSGDSTPLMTHYEQRYKGSGMTRELTAPKTVETLDEKIAKREAKSKPLPDPMQGRVSVEIAGNRYLLGCTDDISETRIKRIASLANTILSETKENNPGLTNSKITTLALIDACDRLVTSQDSLNNMKTDLMYYRQKDDLKKQEIKVDPTPMELLATGAGQDKEDNKEKDKD